MITLRLRYTEALSDEKILESKNRMIIQRQRDKKNEVEARGYLAFDYYPIH
jgi:hypothetical protein